MGIYYQQQVCMQAQLIKDASLEMNAESYGFTFVKKKFMIIIVISKPEDLPDTCTCGKCGHKNGCCCRVAGIKCCKCKGGESCKISITENFIFVNIILVILNTA